MLLGHFTKLILIWVNTYNEERYKRKDKKVGYNFEFPKRSTKTKLVLEQYDSDNDAKNANL